MQLITTSQIAIVVAAAELIAQVIRMCCARLLRMAVSPSRSQITSSKSLFCPSQKKDQKVTDMDQLAQYFLFFAHNLHSSMSVFSV